MIVIPCPVSTWAICYPSIYLQPTSVVLLPSLLFLPSWTFFTFYNASLSLSLPLSPTTILYFSFCHQHRCCPYTSSFQQPPHHITLRSTLSHSLPASQLPYTLLLCHAATFFSTFLSTSHMLPHTHTHTINLNDMSNISALCSSKNLSIISTSASKIFALI